MASRSDSIKCHPALGKPLFEKSGAKTFLYSSREFGTPVLQIKRSLFASFSSEKEVLAGRCFIAR
jgi:hypothetical protein